MANNNIEKVTAYDIAQMIDHSLLRPDMTRQEVAEQCEIAHEYECSTVCVKPCDVEVAQEILKDSPCKVTSVIGFPHGSNLTEVKLLEARRAIEQGCEEIDMVLNIDRLKSGDLDLVEADVKAVCDIAHSSNVKVKVIFENFYLTDDEIVVACKLCTNVGADWVKTSSGYAGGGATVEDLTLMRANTPAHIQVKAAGGVRTLDGALTVRKIGCTRFGATATIKIVEEAREREAAGTLVLPEVVEPLGKKY
jgi:deoxyribose-phosphate aldolase